jgi:hypothetical protein
MRNKALSVCVGILVTVFIAGCTRNDYDNSETDTYTESLTDEIYSSQDSEIRGRQVHIFMKMIHSRILRIIL